jgi:hypothetical protein
MLSNALSSAFQFPMLLALPTGSSETSPKQVTMLSRGHRRAVWGLCVDLSLVLLLIGHTTQDKPLPLSEPQCPHL